MGIKDEFHQKAILTCIEELCKNNQPIRTISPASDQVDQKDGPSHRLLEHSFSTLERCDKCNKYLRGLLHQGFICKDCGLVAHRTCSATNLSPCPSPGLERHVRFNSVFGLALCGQFNPKELSAPKLVILCVQEIESKAISNNSLDLYKLYRSMPPSDQLAELRQKINEDLIKVEFSDFSPYCVATILKKFLRELPDPVIPVQWYDRFLEASREY